LFLGEQLPDPVLNTTDMNITAHTLAQIWTFHGAIDCTSIDPYSAQSVGASPNRTITECISNVEDRLYPTCVDNTNLASTNWLIGQVGRVTYSFIEPQYVRQ